MLTKCRWDGRGRPWGRGSLRHAWSAWRGGQGRGEGGGALRSVRGGGREEGTQRAAGGEEPVGEGNAKARLKGPVRPRLTRVFSCRRPGAAALPASTGTTVAPTVRVLTSSDSLWNESSSAPFLSGETPREPATIHAPATHARSRSGEGGANSETRSCLPSGVPDGTGATWVTSVRAGNGHWLPLCLLSHEKLLGNRNSLHF